MKKLISSILTLLILLSATLPVWADDEEEEINDEQTKEEVLEISTQIDKQPILSSRAAVIYDRTSQKIIWGKAENTRRAMASTTKIMTSLVILEHANLKDIVEISKKAGGTGGSRLGLKAKDKVSVNDLLYGLMLRSGNDAAVALAEYVGGSVQGFAELMNAKALELGLKDTHFVTPHGLDEIEHYTTAYELAKITDYALCNKKFVEIVSTKSTSIRINNESRTIGNTNELLGNLNGVDGVKTGFTNNAGRCLVTSTTREGHQIICVVLGADTKKIRTTDSVKLIEYAFNNYQYINIRKMIEEKFDSWKEEYSKELVINKGKGNKPNIVMDASPINEIPVLKEQVKDIMVEITASTYLEAPIEKGSIIGSIQVKNKEEVLLNVNLRTDNIIEKKNIVAYWWQLLTHYKDYIEEGFEGI